MDICAIDTAIEDLKNGDTTISNVQELACLYIVKDKLENVSQTESDVVVKEFSDVLPQYETYIKTKRQYQQHKITDDAVLESLKFLCIEIKEFLLTLYQNTDMHKERLLIIEMLDKVKEGVK